MKKEDFEFLYVTASMELSRAEIFLIKILLETSETKETFKDLWNRLEKTEKELLESLEKIDQSIG